MHTEIEQLFKLMWIRPFHNLLRLANFSSKQRPGYISIKLEYLVFHCSISRLVWLGSLFYMHYNVSKSRLQSGSHSLPPPLTVILHKPNSGFSQTHKIGNIGIIVNFVFSEIWGFLLYLEYLLLVNIKLDIIEYY